MSGLRHPSIRSLRLGAAVRGLLTLLIIGAGACKETSGGWRLTALRQADG